ncbi:hypothetical protein REPUB_Repub08aG0018300 [Reevesia pubescens]
MYAKCRNLVIATRMFNNIHLRERNTTSWNMLISGYGLHGYGKEALNLFSQMQQLGIKPDHLTFTSLLSACSNAGLIDEGRAGLLHEAFDMVQQMPIPRNDVVWGALLLACRIHGDTELGEIAARGLFQLEPEHAGYYILMSNICAASDRWQEVGKFHSADRVNPYWQEIYRKVESLAVEMKMVGYVPELSCVLHDEEEEDNEHILNYHSES